MSGGLGGIAEMVEVVSGRSKNSQFCNISSQANNDHEQSISIEETSEALGHLMATAWRKVVGVALGVRQKLQARTAQQDQLITPILLWIIWEFRARIEVFCSVEGCVWWTLT